MFIVIDGLDASGKSTQALRLLKFFTAKGKTVCLRVHPSSDNFFGFKAKHFLYSRGKNAHFASAIFYMLDVIRSILVYAWRRYDHIIFVRYLMGTAYLPPPLHKIAYYFFAFIVPRSDVMFFLDIDPVEAYRRICQTREHREMFENLEELEKTREKGLYLALSGKWKIINAGKTKEEVAKDILKLLEVS
ncbi:thymidylate kinase [Candidatus Bathyarchaeota archaeon]|nr:thymidylate kinase [Candidatus Bathyarchaeota archaeon]MBS7630916.1 thymidylate kinase [Candidatus Bathyarchaeota archaeon]